MMPINSERRFKFKPRWVDFWKVEKERQRSQEQWKRTSGERGPSLNPSMPGLTRLRRGLMYYWQLSSGLISPTGIPGRLLRVWTFKAQRRSCTTCPIQDPNWESALRAPYEMQVLCFECARAARDPVTLALYWWFGEECKAWWETLIFDPETLTRARGW
jgi:hypothetical protein